ncbi:YgjV family protein [Vibrio hannami]|uniref:YgjV family protein n=1 Tax=Vibrio hannami TaxID=2717094 RepID=UPI00240FD5DE|nr:YgjV family protein [Vibrio hannami]MDG3084845.1 YgjV family protein [Vibrio hannami]
MVDAFIAQAFGILSLVLGLSTFYQKDDKKLKLVMLALNVSHLIHFLLLGSIVSAIGALLSAFRTGIAIYSKSVWVALIFICISLVSGLMFAENISELWPIAGTIIGTFSIFMLKGIALRFGFLFGATCWLINNILVGSIGGTLLEISVMTMNTITIFRLYRDKRQAMALANQ